MTCTVSKTVIFRCIFTTLKATLAVLIKNNRQAGASTAADLSAG